MKPTNKPGMDSGDLEGWAVPAVLVALVGLL